ncbi:MAG: hypothetical protein J0I19_08210 [Alphaproteobacteria bacterium]|nr:hypothetical protein [Alphaproteobacteria bacterium]
MAKDEQFGFKRLSLDNWLTIDPAWRGVVMSNSVGRPDLSWVHDLVQTNLSPEVPIEVRNLFDVARGALIYSLVFYPLLALGIEQMYRVADVATVVRCTAASADDKATKRYVDRIDWLGKNDIIAGEDIQRWHALRMLRNDTSHPKDQMIMAPGIVLSMISDIIELVDLLFADNTPATT